MKIKLYSQTGKPTDVEAAKAYEQEFKDCYDRLWERKEAGEVSIDDMKDELAAVDAMLHEKYPMFLEVEMPKNGKAWKAFIMKYESPITIAIAEHDKKLALFLMDAEY